MQNRNFENLIEELKQSPKSLIELKSRLDEILTSKHQRTLTIIKPDAVQKGLIGEVIKRLESHDIKPVAMKMVKINKYQAELFYSHLRKKIPKTVFKSIVQYMTSKRVVLIVWQGRGVVKKTRELCGPTDPKKATKQHIRSLSDDNMLNKFQKGRAVKNIIHSSATISDAKKEISFFFLPWEIIN